jgi:hypothetical protein
VNPSTRSFFTSGHRPPAQLPTHPARLEKAHYLALFLLTVTTSIRRAHHPRWEANRVGVEELVLAYLERRD